MKLFAKIETLAWVAVGALGWVLQSKGEGEAIVLGVVLAAAGVLGLLAWSVLMLTGGHQAPDLTAAFGHTMPTLLRAGLLAGLGWLGAFAAQKAGVKTEELAGLASVVVFGTLTKVIDAVKESLDGLLPVAFGTASIKRAYGDAFDVQPGETNMAKVNARNAVHSDLLQIVDSAGLPTESVAGWKLAARQKRLELIAVALH